MKGTLLVLVGLGATPVEAAEPAGARVVPAAAGLEVACCEGATGVKTLVVVETGVWVVNGPLVTVTVWLGVAV